MDDVITTKQIKDLYLNDQIVTDIDIEQLTSCNDYTAFEVFPTNVDIPAGTVSDTITHNNFWSSTKNYAKNDAVLNEENETAYTCILDCPASLKITPGITDGWQTYWKEGIEHFDGYYYKYTIKVPANNYIKLDLQSYKNSREECDVVIDWGNGDITKVSDLNNTNVTFSNFEHSNHGTHFHYSGISIEYTYPDKDCVCEISNNKITKSNKFIIKIYGKDYFRLRANTINRNSIVSRVFDRDLPIASHVINLSNAFSNGYRLLNVSIPYCYSLFGRYHASEMFAIQSNLRYVNISEYCNLKFITCSAMFALCENLECDINNFNALFGYESDSMNWRKLFIGCKKIYGTIDPKVYWENEVLGNYGFESINDAVFLGCSDDIVKQVPMDWLAYDRSQVKYTITAGKNYCIYNNRIYRCKKSNADIIPTVSENWETYWEEVKDPWLSYSYKYIDGNIYKSRAGKLTKITNIAEEHINKIECSDYTAFEVFPTNVDIPAGTIDEDTGLDYKVEVPAYDICGLDIKTKQLQKDSNIIIDWGDGKITDVKNTVSESSSPTYDINRDSMYYPTHDDVDEIKIEFTHKYEKQGKYIVKIYGNTYWGIRGKYSNSFKNIISRIFEKDLPIASCVVNVSALCRQSLKIQQIKIANYTIFNNIINITALFYQCTNLITAIGFSRDFGTKASNNNNIFPSIMYGCETIFYYCKNLISCDLSLPQTVNAPVTGRKSNYRECNNLNVDVLKLIPESGFCEKIIDMTYIFNNCSSLSCSDYDKLEILLWGDTSKHWTNTEKCFTGCTSLDLTKIPTSWGGTNKEIETKLQLKKLGVDTSDYTAFEVYPTNKDFNAGDKSIFEFGGPTWSVKSSYITGDVVYHSASDVVYKCLKDCVGIEPNVTDGWRDYWKVHADFTNKYYNYIRPTKANAICKISFYESSRSQSDSDMVVDWGDGTISRVSDDTDSNITYEYNGSYSEGTLTHTYSNPDNITTYVVKIYGTKYYMLRTGSSNTENRSIISRVFARDLPMASQLVNISSLCAGSNRLFEVRIPYEYKMYPVNLASLFNACRNLRYVTIGDGVLLKKLQSIQYIFSTCPNLECNINNFNRLLIHGTEEADYTNLYIYDDKLYGTINPDVYWNNPNLNTGIIKQYSGMFYRGPKNLIKSVPLDWQSYYLLDVRDYTIPSGCYGIYKNKYYKCIKVNTNITPTVTEGWETYWEEVKDPYLSYKLITEGDIKYRQYENGLIFVDEELPENIFNKKSVFNNDVEIKDSQLNILSGNYIQTTDTYTSAFGRNVFIQAETVMDDDGITPKYQKSSAGTRGWVIIGVNKDENAIQLSGDTSELNSPEIINKMVFSAALGSSSATNFTTISEVSSNGWIKLNTWNETIFGSYHNKTQDVFIKQYTNNDNGFFCMEDSMLGNQVLENFYGQHAEGGSVKAIGKYAHAEGRRTIAGQRYAHAEGDGSAAYGQASHAEGFQTVTQGNYAHAENRDNIASGRSSHAEGELNIAEGMTSHSGGQEGSARGIGAFSHGFQVAATGDYSLALGVRAQSSGKNNFEKTGSLHVFRNDVVVWDADNYCWKKDENQDPADAIVATTKNLNKFSNNECYVLNGFYPSPNTRYCIYDEESDLYSIKLNTVGNGHDYSFVWNSIPVDILEYNKENPIPPYRSHGEGTFNLNPKNGIDGIYIGEKTLPTCIQDIINKGVDAKTTSANKQITTIALNINSGNYVNGIFGIASITKASSSNFIEIDWGDGSEPEIIIDDYTPIITHKYKNQGTYIVEMSDDVKSFRLDLNNLDGDIGTKYLEEKSGNKVIEIYSYTEKLTELAHRAFGFSLSQLKNVYLKNVSQLDNHSTFYICTSLSSCIVPSIQSIPSNCYKSCNKLSSIFIPYCTNVDQGAFEEIKSPLSVTLGNVTTIGKVAFSKSNIAYIDLRRCEQVPTIQGDTFGGLAEEVKNNLSIILPSDLSSDFSANAYWNKLSSNFYYV